MINFFAVNMLQGPVISAVFSFCGDDLVPSGCKLQIILRNTKKQGSTFLKWRNLILWQVSIFVDGHRSPKYVVKSATSLHVSHYDSMKDSTDRCSYTDPLCASFSLLCLLACLFFVIFSFFMCVYVDQNLLLDLYSAYKNENNNCYCF